MPSLQIGKPFHMVEGRLPQLCIVGSASIAGQTRSEFADFEGKSKRNHIRARATGIL
jgi:hypothetical protein